MRVCLVSNFAGSLDEGMMSISYHLGEGLSRRHDVLHVNARKCLFSNKVWNSVKTFDPQIIHFILRPSVGTLLLARLMKCHFSKAKVLFSALQPPSSHLNLWLASALKPDLVFTQSIENERLFTRIGCETSFLPNGVDLNRFSPVSKEAKIELRKKYSIGPNKFVVLHVGHLVEGRNVHILSDLQSDDTQVIIVSSAVFEPNACIHANLKAHGCQVWLEHLPRIEEVYALSDCYVFPTVSKTNCVEIPLSVMEAMSCNLPVVTTKFGTLPEIFKEGDGLVFIEQTDVLDSAVSDLKDKLNNKSVNVETRRKVLSFSWENVVSKLETQYRRMTAE